MEFVTQFLVCHEFIFIAELLITSPLKCTTQINHQTNQVTREIHAEIVAYLTGELSPLSLKASQSNCNITIHEI